MTALLDCCPCCWSQNHEAAVSVVFVLHLSLHDGKHALLAHRVSLCCICAMLHQRKEHVEEDEALHAFGLLMGWLLLHSHDSSACCCSGAGWCYAHDPLLLDSMCSALRGMLLVTTAVKVDTPHKLLICTMHVHQRTSMLAIVTPCCCQG